MSARMSTADIQDLSVARYSRDELLQLAREDSPCKRILAAKNPTTPSDTLTWLAGDADIRVRRAVAENSRSGADALQLLSGDSDEHVRLLLAKHPLTSPTTLQEMADYSVARRDLTQATALARHTALPPECAEALHSLNEVCVHQALAVNDSTNGDMLAALSESDDNLVLDAVAVHPNTRERTCGRIIRDSPRLMREVAQRHDMGEQFMISLAQQADNATATALARNPKLTHAAAQVLMDAADHKVLWHFASVDYGDKDHMSAEQAADLLHQLSSHENVQIRTAVANNASAASATLILLMADADTAVRQAASLQFHDRRD